MQSECRRLPRPTPPHRKPMTHANSKYRPEYADKAAELALLGATDRILAAVFAVDEDTIRRWKHAHPEFSQALLQKKTEANMRVARSLYDQALGYDYTTEEAVKYKDKDGNERVKVVTVTKHIPAKTTAAIFWLKNREPELWRDVQQVEHSGLESLLGEIMNTSRGLPSAEANTQSFRKHYGEQTRH